MFAWQVWQRNREQPEGLVFANRRFEGEIMYLASKLSGPVMELNVAAGDAVEAHQVLAALEDQALRALNS